MTHLWFRLSSLLFAAGLLLTPAPDAGADAAASGSAVTHHLRIEASSFEFSPGVISVKPGDQVVLELAATDVVHGFYLEGYELEVTADPGQSATLAFTADKSGTFRFRCSVSCGSLHPFMIGKLKVGTNGLLWQSIGASLLIVLAALWGWRK